MELKITKREAGKIKTLIKKWVVPGIIYGKHVETPISIQFNKNEFIKLYKQIGTSTPITLKWEWIEKMVLIHDLQLNPVKDTLIHVDFLWIKKWEKVKANVIINVSGIETLKKEWLEMNVVMDTIEIEAIPSKLINHIDIDASNLKDWENITVSSINLDKDVDILTDKDETIVTVYTPRGAKVDEEESSEESTETSTEETSDK